MITFVREIVKNGEMITKDEMFDFLAADETWLEFSIYSELVWNR